MNIRQFAILAILIGFIAVPAFAGTKYMSGGPDMTAAIAGSNEFEPGQDVVIRVNLENKGLIDIKFVQSGIVDRDDLPNTAKLVNVALSPGNAPLVVKTDPQMVGDILGGRSAQVSFLAKIDSDAPSGEYLLPLTLGYTYLRFAEQSGQDSISYVYKDVNETLSLPIRIEPRLFLGVVSSESEHLISGNEGYVSLTLQNRGDLDAESAIIKIARNGNSPVVPTDSSVYIGDFPANATVEVSFKVAVSRDASAQTYPLDVFAVYENEEGDTITSDSVTVGIPVEGKMAFSVISHPGEISAGEKKVLEVEYQNTGTATAYHAQARLSAVDPFTSNDDTAYLGDLAPGQSAVARYEVSVDESATAKEYGLDSEIRYRDALDNSQISDTMKVRIPVREASSVIAMIGIILIIAAVAGGAGYYFLVMRKKK